MFNENADESQLDFLKDQPFNSIINKKLIRDDSIPKNVDLYLFDYPLEKYEFIIGEPADFLDLVYCAFFATHFCFFQKYSYFIAFGPGFTQLSNKQLPIPDNCVLYFQKDKCCLNILNFLKNSRDLKKVDDKQQEVHYIRRMQPKSFISYITNFLSDFGYCFYFDQLSPAQTSESIKAIIESDYEKTKTPKYCIFEVSSPMSYRIPVQLNGTLFYYRIVWGIGDRKMFFVDNQRNILEIDNSTRQFVKRGVQNLDQIYSNLNYVCFTLDMS